MSTHTPPSRSRSPWVLLAAVVVAALVVVVLVVALSGGKKGTTTTVPPAAAGTIPGQKESAAMLDGIAQNGIALGDPKAPVTLLEFADLQCPFCKEFALQTLPLLVRDYVRTGKVRIQYQDLAFLGPQSKTAAAAAAAAGEQNKLWTFADLFYYNQGQENSGYVTDAFVTRLYRAIPGLDAAKANAARKGPPATDAWVEPQRLAKQYGIDSTPSFVYGKTGGPLKPLDTPTLGYSDFQKPLEQLIAQTG
jgi:protein-disulfide isomerase